MELPSASTPTTFSLLELRVYKFSTIGGKETRKKCVSFNWSSNLQWVRLTWDPEKWLWLIYPPLIRTLDGRSCYLLIESVSKEPFSLTFDAKTSNW